MDGRIGSASGMGRIICCVDFEELELELSLAGNVACAAAIASKFANLLSQSIRFSVQCLAITEIPTNIFCY